MAVVSLHSSLSAVAAPTWWSKQGSFDQHRIARLINGYPRPLVLGDDQWPRLLSLRSSLRSDARLERLPARPSSTVALPVDQPVLLYRPSPEWLASLRHSSGRATCLLEQSPPRFPYLPHVDQYATIWVVLSPIARRLPSIQVGA